MAVRLTDNSNVMLKGTLLYIVIFFISIAWLSCSKPLPNNSFQFDKADNVKLNGIDLTHSQIDNIEKLLNNLPNAKKDTYSRAPLFITSFENDKLKQVISIFKKEMFVYKGVDLDSWEDRMKGKESKGYKANKALIELLEDIVNKKHNKTFKTDQLPPAA